MKILYLNHNVIWKSAFHRCFQFAKRLAKKGHEVTIVTNDPISRWSFKEEMVNGVKIVRTPDLLWGSLRTGWDLINAARRISYLKDKQFDLIHAFDTRPTVIFPALYLKQKLNVPLVIDWGDWWGRGGAIRLRQPVFINRLFEPIETFFEEYFRRFADYTTVVSNKLAKRAEQHVNNKADICVIENGSDTEAIKPVGQNKARKELGLSDKEYVATFSGYVMYDIELIFNCFRKLAEEKYPIKLLVIGGEKKAITKTAADLIEKKVLIYKGTVDFNKVGKYINAADIALLPLSNTIANQARYPMKFGDYLAAGKPVITNNVGLVGTAVKKYNLGKTCSFSANHFAKAIKSMIDSKQYQTVSENCIKFARGEHNYNKRVIKLLNVYNELTK